MKVCVVIPWWPSEDPWRARWLPKVLTYWDMVGVGPVLISHAGEEGKGRNVGIEACGADVIVSADADCFIAFESAREAVAMAAASPGLVVPHDRRVSLPREASERLTSLASAPMNGDRRWPYTPGAALVENSVGGIVVFNRETWEGAGGYDEEIVRGYDAAFAIATGSLVAPQRRFEGDQIHLWHEPVEEDWHVWEQVRAYEFAAEQGPEAMRALVAAR